MKTQIQSHFKSKVLEPVQVIKSGSIFGYKTKEKGWARARVLSSNQEKSNLLLGDVGEVTEVANDELRELPEEFKLEDFFAFRVTIPVGDWSTEVELAEDFLNTNPIIVEVRKSVLYSHYIILYFLDHKPRKLLYLFGNCFNRSYGDSRASLARNQADREI